MVKFYFTAVSNSAKQKLIGSVSATNEKDAREQLNKIGMAILSLGLDQPSDWQNAFDFNVLDRAGREVTGELIAESAEAVFDCLAEELDLRTINYICDASASEEEKLHARESSIKTIIEQKKKEEEQKTEFEKRTIVGSWKSLVNLGEQKKTAKWEESLKKFSNEGEDDFTKATAADFAMPAKPATGLINKAGLETSAQKPIVAPVANLDEEQDLTLHGQIQNLKNKFKQFCSSLVEKSGKFYFLMTEIVVPPKGKTRADGWREMREFLFPPRQSSGFSHVAAVKARSEEIHQLGSIRERFWIAFEEIVDLLAAVFLAYFTLGVVALYVEIPRVTALAETTLRGNLMIPFFAGVFIFIRILIFLRAKFTSWSFLRTSLLFLTGGLIVVFAGMNLL